MKSKKKGMGSAKVDMGFPLRENKIKKKKVKKKLIGMVTKDDDSICERHDSNCI